MISRKIMKRLEAFYSEGGKSALLIDGARQVGKTCLMTMRWEAKARSSMRRFT